jgi:hypothetical protein
VKVYGDGGTSELYLEAAPEPSSLAGAMLAAAGGMLAVMISRRRK